MVPDKIGSNKRQAWATRWIAGLLVFCGGAWVPQLPAQQTSTSTWRDGVSRWTGNGYVTSQPSTTSSSSEISEAPYTIPVDPARLPTTGGIAVSGSAPQANPYFQSNPDVESNPSFPLPGIEPIPSLQLTSPSDLPAAGNIDSKSFIPGAASSAVLPPVPSPPVKGTTSADASRSGVQQPPASTVPVPDVNEAGDVGELVDLPPPDSLPPETIGEQIEDGAVVEEPPLESEVIRWYQYPQRWIRGWDSHAEFGLDGSTGNARTLALQTGLEMKRTTDLYTLALDLDYRQASNRSTTTEDNGQFNLDFDRMVRDTRWAGFGKFGMEWDKFKAFDLRLNVNGGLGYHWVRRDDASFVTRFGAGASKEIGAPDDDWIPEAVFGAEAERQLNSRQKLKGKIDYFPAWEDFSNFRLVSDVAWEILLDDSDNLSLKLAATDRYDSTPQGAKKNDLYYSLLLLYKF